MCIYTKSIHWAMLNTQNFLVLIWKNYNNLTLKLLLMREMRIKFHFGWNSSVVKADMVPAFYKFMYQIINAECCGGQTERVPNFPTTKNNFKEPIFLKFYL